MLTMFWENKMNLLDFIDQMLPWKEGSRECPLCGKQSAFFVQDSNGTGACSCCFEKRLNQVLSKSKKPQWLDEDLIFNLSPTGTMKNRLLGLVHAKEFQEINHLPNLIIYNLGFDRSHPLSKFVRQKAMNACSEFKDKNKMMQHLLNYKNFTNYYQMVNIAMAAYLLEPEEPKVKALITRMAKDESSNVRSHMDYMIRDDKRPWTKPLLEMLSKDTSPMVMEACQHNQGNQDTIEKTIFRKTDSIPEKRPRPYNSIENIILRYLHFPLHEKVHELYLSHIPDLLDGKKYNAEEIKALKQNTKDSQIRLLGQSLASKSLFNTILKKLPQEVLFLLQICIDNPYGLDLALAEQKCFQLMNKESCDVKNKQPLYKIIKKNPEFFLFKVEKSWAHGSQNNKDLEIALNRGISSYVEKFLPKLPAHELIPVEDVEKRVDHLHMDDHGIFETLPVSLAFIAQDNLQFAKNSDKILASSLKKMAAACKIKEFYAEKNKELLYLKTRGIADFFTCKSAWTPEDLKDVPAFIKCAIRDYFKFKDFKNYRAREGFEYIKRQIEIYDSDNDEIAMRTSLYGLLKLLPLGKWVSTSNLGLAGAEKGLKFFPFSDKNEMQELYISMDSRTGYRDRDRQNLTALYPFDAVALPFIRRMMFLLGTLGIVDLAYSSPTNTIYREYGKPYLTAFDGLKYVRLTDFGDYVLGWKKTFKTQVIISSGTIELHENKTLLSIQGEDPIKRMALDAVGEPINKTSYRVNYKSFLKDCSTSKEVENKITFFRENIAKKPPAIWEEFFEHLLARMNPLNQIPAMVAFKVKPDKELIWLLTTDTILKKHVIRAENYHLLVQQKDLAKVKKRLALFGYFVS